MKAAVLGEKGLEIRDVPVPKPKPGEIQVRVKAAGLNRAKALEHITRHREVWAATGGEIADSYTEHYLKA